MPERCISCRLNKKRIFFDIDKARVQAKKQAIEQEKTFCIFKEGKGVSFTDADTAITKGYDITEFLSQYT